MWSDAIANAASLNAWIPCTESDLESLGLTQADVPERVQLIRRRCWHMLVLDDAAGNPTDNVPACVSSSSDNAEDLPRDGDDGCLICARSVVLVCDVVSTDVTVQPPRESFISIA